MGTNVNAAVKQYAIVDSSDIRAAVVKLEQARVVNSHSFGHNRASEPQPEPEGAKGMVN